MDQVCKNHPNRKTKKKCSHCHQYICSECQWTLHKKIYCGISCYLKAYFHSILQHLKPPKKAKKSTHSGFAKFFYFGFFAFFILFMVLLWNSNRKLDSKIVQLQAALKEQTQTTRSAYPWCDSTNFDVTSVPEAMVQKNTIGIEGEAPSGMIIGAKVNGRLKAVTLSKDNHFVFDNIELSYGSNEIIVQGLSEEGKPLVLEKLMTIYGSPSRSFLSRSFIRGNIQQRQIALTFDGGSGDGAARDILDYLKNANLRCTIFLTGHFLRRYPLLVQRMIADGHEIGNHTWSHPHLTTYAQNHRHLTLPGMTKERLQDELKKTADFFYNLTKHHMKPYWRPPYGEENAEIRSWASELGYTCVGWTMANGENMDTLDWVADSTENSYRSSKEILKKILTFGSRDKTGANGGIILMHLDTQRDHDPAHKMIPALIDSMQNRGYQFVTISEMMSTLYNN
jgi:peptidoglycan/xylan/chitin deacetylase (PgdA/CDA1 family)